MTGPKDRLGILLELLGKNESKEMVLSALKDLIKICVEQQEEIVGLRRLILRLRLGDQPCE